MKKYFKIFKTAILMTLPATSFVALSSCSGSEHPKPIIERTFDVNFQITGIPDCHISNIKAKLYTEFNTTISFDVKNYALKSINVYCGGVKLLQGQNVSILYDGDSILIKVFDFSITNENLIVTADFEIIKKIPNDLLDITNDNILLGLKAGADIKEYNTLCIPQNVKTISERAFFNKFSNDSNIKNLIFEKNSSLLVIQKSAFEGCDALTSQLILPSSVIKIEKSAFMNCSKISGLLQLPDDITSIGDSAFEKCSSLSQIIFPQCLEILGNYAFAECTRLTGQITFSNSLEQIGNYAFYNCQNLDGLLNLKSNCSIIGDYAFYNCKKISGTLILPDRLTYIGDYAFYNCESLSGNLTIGGYIQTIGPYAFANCRQFSGTLKISSSILKTINEGTFCNSTFVGIVNFAESYSLTTIGKNAFKNCEFINGLNFNSTLQEIGEGAFDGCISLNRELQIPSAVTSIGDYAFANCSRIPNVLDVSQASIGRCAFYGCASLKALVFSIGTKISHQAFYNCTSVENINVAGLILDTVPESWSTFYVFNNLAPKGTVIIDHLRHREMWANYFSSFGVIFDDSHWKIEVGKPPSI